MVENRTSEVEEDILLLCIEPVNVDPTCIDYFQQNGIDVYYFEDVDECIEYYLALNSKDVHVFVWLGFGWNHLIPILDDFQHVHCMYLSEISEHKYTPKVHGVFNDPMSLSQQVLRDIRICQQSQSLHLTISDNRETSTIQNPQGNAIHSIWSDILLQGLLRMPVPPTDVYAEMIKEARFFYRKNSSQLAQIEQFEKNYRPGDAIRWYSRDSFVYRLVNKALRTQNLAILFKFRFFIRDVYEQLNKLFRKQYLSDQSANHQPTTITLYRAMTVSSEESNHLRSCQSGTILSINSFVSTSLNVEVAMTYLGNDLERDIMLEIVIDRKSLDGDSSPFADIRALSSIPDEEEVLLSMGSTLLVESVTTNSKYKNICIQARLCYEMHPNVKELRTFILNTHLRSAQSESFYIDSLMELVHVTSNYEKLEQMFKLSKLDNTNVQQRLYYILSQFDALMNSTTYADETLLPTISEMELAIKEYIFKFLSDTDLPIVARNLLLPLLECLPNISNLSDVTNIDERIPSSLLSVMNDAESYLTLSSFPQSHPVWLQMHLIRGIFDSIVGDHTQALKHFNAAHTSPAALLSNQKSVMQHLVTTQMATSTAALGHNNRALQILEDLCRLEKPSVQGLLELAKRYESEEDWSMSILCYRRIIEDCNLPPNSSAISQAYFDIGSAFLELDDTESALYNYYQARKLLLQHHSSTHPLLHRIQLSIAMTELKRNLREISQLFDTNR
ncbi:hypothetical protein I4U23_027007 [Adineta vaga]|nr:hypothetical protein I4U23_027007 [Adineta vaga]